MTEGFLLPINVEEDDLHVQSASWRIVPRNL
jgi:hypothetical protein